MWFLNHGICYHNCMGRLSEFGAYEVEISDEGEYIAEFWSRGGVLHRIGKPAIIHYDPKTRAEILRVYKFDGLTHRKDGPAIEEIDPETGIVSLEEYYEKGQMHRMGKPAKITYNPKTGNLSSIEHHEFGQWMKLPSKFNPEP